MVRNQDPQAFRGGADRFDAFLAACNGPDLGTDSDVSSSAFLNIIIFPFSLFSFFFVQSLKKRIFMEYDNSSFAFLLCIFN